MSPPTDARVLMVDDDANVLASYRRGLGRQFRLLTANGPAEGLELVARDGPFAVIVSDMKMPGMDGVAFFARVKRLAPDSTRIMLTGCSDQETAMKAVNEGAIFRFLTKPCPVDTLAEAVRTGIEQYRLVTAERELLEKTLTGSMKVLTDLLAMVKPVAFGRAARVRRMAAELAGALGADAPWEIETAALLSQIGCVAVPDEILAKVARGALLTPEEARVFHAHPTVGRKLLEAVPRLDAVAEIVGAQELRFDGGPAGREPKGDRLPLGARILKVVLDFDALVSAGTPPRKAVERLEKRPGWYDPKVLALLPGLVEADEERNARPIRLDELRDGMILADDVRSLDGVLLLGRGQEVTPSMRLRLRNAAQQHGVREPLRVLVTAVPAVAPS